MVATKIINSLDKVYGSYYRELCGLECLLILLFGEMQISKVTYVYISFMFHYHQFFDLSFRSVFIFSLLPWVFLSVVSV